MNQAIVSAANVVPVIVPAPHRPKGRPRVYASSVDQTAAARERQRAKGLMLGWVLPDYLAASRAAVAAAEMAALVQAANAA